MLRWKKFLMGVGLMVALGGAGSASDAAMVWGGNADTLAIIIPRTNLTTGVRDTVRLGEADLVNLIPGIKFAVTCAEVNASTEARSLIPSPDGLQLNPTNAGCAAPTAPGAVTWQVWTTTSDTAVATSPGGLFGEHTTWRQVSGATGTFGYAASASDAEEDRVQLITVGPAPLISALGSSVTPRFLARVIAYQVDWRDVITNSVPTEAGEQPGPRGIAATPNDTLTLTAGGGVKRLLAQDNVYLSRDLNNIAQRAGVTLPDRFRGVGATPDTVALFGSWVRYGTGEGLGTWHQDTVFTGVTTVPVRRAEFRQVRTDSLGFRIHYLGAAANARGLDSAQGTFPLIALPLKRQMDITVAAYAAFAQKYAFALCEQASNSVFQCNGNTIHPVMVPGANEEPDRVVFSVDPEKNYNILFRERDEDGEIDRENWTSVMESDYTGMVVTPHISSTWSATAPDVINLSSLPLGGSNNNVGKVVFGVNEYISRILIGASAMQEVSATATPDSIETSALNNRIRHSLSVVRNPGEAMAETPVPFIVVPTARTTSGRPSVHVDTLIGFKISGFGSLVSDSTRGFQGRVTGLGGDERYLWYPTRNDASTINRLSRGDGAYTFTDAAGDVVDSIWVNNNFIRAGVFGSEGHMANSTPPAAGFFYSLDNTAMDALLADAVGEVIFNRMNNRGVAGSNAFFGNTETPNTSLNAVRGDLSISDSLGHVEIWDSLSKTAIGTAVGGSGNAWTAGASMHRNTAVTLGEVIRSIVPVVNGVRADTTTAEGNRGKISFVSSNPSVLDIDGTVNRPRSDADPDAGVVTLTASYNVSMFTGVGATRSVDIPVVVSHTKPTFVRGMVEEIIVENNAQLSTIFPSSLGNNAATSRFRTVDSLGREVGLVGAFLSKTGHPRNPDSSFTVPCLGVCEGHVFGNAQDGLDTIPGVDSVVGTTFQFTTARSPVPVSWVWRMTDNAFDYDEGGLIRGQTTVFVRTGDMNKLAINRQPVNRTHTTTGTINDSLIVEAQYVKPNSVSREMDVQWYQVPSADFPTANLHDSMMIDGATRLVYRLPANLAAGEHYYVARISTRLTNAAADNPSEEDLQEPEEPVLFTNIVTVVMNRNRFVPATKITLEYDNAVLDVTTGFISFTLVGTVEPDTATNTTIRWRRISGSPGMIVGNEVMFARPGVLLIEGCVINGTSGTANFCQNFAVPVSEDGKIRIAENDREVVTSEDVAVVTTPRAVASLVAGPNPASKSGPAVQFFVNGVDAETVVTGSLRIFDSNGNFVKSVDVAEGWDFTDARNRPVAVGTYLVRGSLNVGGSRVSVSTLVGVAE